MTKDAIADNLRRQAYAARDLVAALRDDGHCATELVHDMVEGETSLFDALSAAVSEIDECDIMVDGLKAKIDQLRTRMDRASGRSERLRSLIEQAMLVGGVQSARIPSATLTIKDVAPRPLISDEAAIPSEFWRQPDPIIDKTKINAAVKDGRAIPGVTMSNGGTALQIRRA